LKARRAFLLVAASAFSTLLVMCAPGGMESIGDAMVDAGHMLRDGAADVTSDAQAQACATDCTTGGVLRVMTADADPAQLVMQSVRAEFMTSATAGEGAAVLGQGPLVLTDYSDMSCSNGIVSVVPAGHTCAEYTYSNALAGSAFNFFAFSTGNVPPGGSVVAAPIHGARILVPAGATLCLYAAPAPTGQCVVSYAGFHPYQ